MGASGFAEWTHRFETERDRRAAGPDPQGESGASLPPAVRASIQRFQAGEDGDSSGLFAKADAAGDPAYSAAVRLFVAEEKNHARLLALLLEAGGATTQAGHWSDAAFARLRRLPGLRTELLLLMVAEVVALHYHRALREGTDDPLTSEVAGRILADEERHVPFHYERLRASVAELPRAARRAVLAGWRVMLLGAGLVVAADHGRALRTLGVGRGRFVAEVVGSGGPVVSAVLGTTPMRVPTVSAEPVGGAAGVLPDTRGPSVDSEQGPPGPGLALARLRRFS
ncbi:ferritin-like domain-containing protein [Streptomyces sp. NBC_01214]|uniref:ferritin-like domain-containing protein n=1 Tax=Streptomyces sp. NBC_01214 TaxID=2903777 RepID=UPI002254900B|nr:ferritin-like domain-containing protein [Streptomyces sp. NBC_01214]MCX4808466.1 ferritin-like domain-containing protein [Streptomyces sp. NBC_01214]